MQASNYFFLLHFCKRFQQLVKGASIEKILAVSSREIIFSLSSHTFKLLCLRGNSIYHLEENRHELPSRGRVLFTDTFGEKITEIIPLTYDRSFLIRTSGERYFWVRLYGTNGNVLYYENKEALPQLFRNNLENDRQRPFPELKEETDLLKALEEFPHEARPKQFAFFPPEFFTVAGNNSSEINQALQTFRKESFYLYQTETGAELSFFRLPGKAVIFNNAVIAANEYFRLTASQYFYREKRDLLQQKIDALGRKTNASLQSSLQKLHYIDSKYPNEKIGHLLMAYLHEVKKGDTQVSLPDFETGNPVQIRLKKELSPAENAEWYYKKSKNEYLEEKILREQAEMLQQRMQQLAEIRSAFEQCTDFRSLKQFEQTYFPSGKTADKEEKFRRFELDGYVIYAGKSAENNDELTLKFAHKNDLWLHAAHVSGSHVIIRNPEGKFIPDKVIHKAAGIAAYYSKSKSSALVPVIVTQKKFVRKPKGAAPGSVQVDNTSTVMVKAELPF